MDLWNIVDGNRNLGGVGRCNCGASLLNSHWLNGNRSANLSNVGGIDDIGNTPSHVGIRTIGVEGSPVIKCSEPVTDVILG